MDAEFLSDLDSALDELANAAPDASAAEAGGRRRPVTSPAAPACAPAPRRAQRGPICRVP